MGTGRQLDQIINRSSVWSNSIVIRNVVIDKAFKNGTSGPEANAVNKLK